MPTLEIKLLGPLLVAGDASLLGANLATARRTVGMRSVPYIPGTALRGAVRLQLESLLRGAGQAAVGPYPFETSTDASPKDVVARLFGFSAPRGERETYRDGGQPGAQEGRLRFGDGLPVDGAQAEAAIRIRPGLELDDATASAADQKLFFREMADVGCDLIFRAPLELYGVSEADRNLLRAAVETTDALGAGKAKGGGEIAIRWLEEEDACGVQVLGSPTHHARRARLSITLLEPAHWGDGGPIGNHQATRTHLPGATVRGALAWALLRGGQAQGESEEFQRLFVGPESARFGDALFAATAGAGCRVLPATRRKERRSGEIVDGLVLELARASIDRRLSESGSPLALRADDGSRRLDSMPARPEGALLRRTRTRVSIDRATGTAADGKLFSIEQVEPETSHGTSACFEATIERIPEGGAGLLARLAGLPVSFGAGRNHGLGRARVELQFEAEKEDAKSVEQAVRDLSQAVEEEAARLTRRAGLPFESSGQERLILALVAEGDYVPTDEKAAHPLAELASSNTFSSLEPTRRFLLDGEAGGFDLRPDRRGPQKDLLPAIGAGSVFVYEIEPHLLPVLPPLLSELRCGVGRRTESGCGRFALHSGQDIEPSSPTGASAMSTGLSASQLVERAEELLKRVHENEKPKGKKSRFWGQTSQLRNLVQIAQAETEVPVLRNFLRYQQGRKSTRDFWELLGDDVIRTLEEIGEATSEAADRGRAIRSYFGYLVRHYVYLNETQRNDQDAPEATHRDRDARSPQGGRRAQS